MLLIVCLAMKGSAKFFFQIFCSFCSLTIFLFSRKRLRERVISGVIYIFKSFLRIISLLTRSKLHRSLKSTTSFFRTAITRPNKGRSTNWWEPKIRYFSCLANPVKTAHLADRGHIKSFSITIRTDKYCCMETSRKTSLGFSLLCLICSLIRSGIKFQSGRNLMKKFSR